MDADDLDLATLVDQAGSADTDPSDADATDIAPEPDPAGEPGDEADAQPPQGQEQWTPERRKAYIDATSKYSSKVKQAEAEKAALQAERDAVKRELDFYRQRAEQPASQAPKAPDDPEHANRRKIVEDLFKESDLYKQMQQQIEHTGATARSVMAAHPEAYIDANEIDPETIKEITPALRQMARGQKDLTPDTIKLMAAHLAAPKLTAQLQAFRKVQAQARKRKAESLQKSQTASSGGMEDAEKAFGEMGLEEQDKTLAVLFADYKLPDE